MAQLGIAFDPNTVEPSKGGGDGAHPCGIFRFEIQETEVKPTNSGNGKILAFQAVNLGEEDPTLKNRKVYCNINIQNESAQAQTIGQSELSALCAAMGFTDELTDSDQLRYQPFFAEVKWERAMQKNPVTKKYDTPKNNAAGEPLFNAVIKRYLFGDAEGEPGAAAAPAQKQQPQQQVQQPAAASGARSWRDKAA